MYWGGPSTNPGLGEGLNLEIFVGKDHDAGLWNSHKGM
jgi:hypothetical protein